MALITMTREMGSRGRDVARGLVDALGLHVVHKEVVEHHLAQRMNVQESLVHRYLEGDVGIFEKWRLDGRTLARYTAEQIYELAERGNVLIRGWGATQLLRPVSHAICVRVCAPLEARVATLTERLGLEDSRAALKEIQESDAAHTKAIRGLSQGDWQDPALYDLVLNTERLSIGACVDLVGNLVEDPAFAETPASRATLAELKRAAIERRLDLRPGAPSPDAWTQPNSRATPRPRYDGPTSREERDLFV